MDRGSLDEQLLRECLDALSRFFVGAASLEATLRSVTELAERALPQAEMTGATMLIAGRPGTAVFTNDVAPEIDASRYGTAEGPFLEASRTGQVVVIDSVASDSRFPSFCRAADRHGVVNTMSLPPVAGGDGIGALNLYSRTAVAYSEEDTMVSERFALQASVVLANSQAYWDSRLLSEHWPRQWSHAPRSSRQRASS